MEADIKKIKAWLGQGSINIFGMPYAGKDTQGHLLAGLFEAELMGGGKILRNSVIPEHVKEIMEAGSLIPTADYLDIVLPYLSQPAFKGKPLMLSSVGRWDGEQEGVLEATTASGHQLKAVILLTINEAIAKERHSIADAQGDREARADDDKTVFDNRLNEFRTKTMPVVDFYRSKGLLIEVDGSDKPPQVTQAIIHKLAEKISNI